jgi:hypothetical protein
MLAAILLLAQPTPPPTLAINSLIVGTFVKGKWKVFGEKPPAWKNLRFQEVLVGKAGKTVKVAKAEIFGMTGTPCLAYSEETSREVLVSGITPTYPRKVVRLKSPPNFAEAAVKKLYGSDPVSYVDILQSDFDGDKSLDTIVHCRKSPEDSDPLHGDWASVLWVRPGYPTSVLSFENDLASDGFKQFDLPAVADFNKDGCYELVIARWFHEGLGGQLWSLTRSGAKLMVQKDD